jgi:GTPase SAR1 family protein
LEDISPQEEYRALLEQIMKSCSGVVILYSISDRDSFLKAVGYLFNVCVMSFGNSIRLEKFQKERYIRALQDIIYVEKHANHF